MSLQRISDLLSATVNFLSLPSATAKLHIIHKTFALTYPRMEKLKYCVTNQANIMAKMLHFYSKQVDHAILKDFL